VKVDWAIAAPEVASTAKAINVFFIAIISKVKFGAQSTL
jgi:hypothetical protein